MLPLRHARTGHARTRHALTGGTRRGRAATFTAALVTWLAAVLAFALPSTAAHAAATAQFNPGQTWQDSAGGVLQLHGLGIVKSGSTWYGFGEDKTGENSGDASFQDIPCYSSTDLAHWTKKGQALTRQADGDLGPNRVVERPKVIYNASTHTYVMYLHIDSSSYGDAKVGVATSSTPCGPYTYRGSFRPLGFESRDLNLFQDTDGTAYLLSEDRSNGLRIDKLSADYLSVTSAVAVLPDYEAPAMAKVGGRYFLLGSHLSGWSTNDNDYATATSLAGPWSGWRPFAAAGTSTYDSQTANIIPVQGSSGTTYIYAGDRWNTSDLGSSALVWLPMTISGSTLSVGWQNSWTLDPAAGTWSNGSSNPADGTRTLANANSSLLMDVSGGSTADGAAVIQWGADGGANQKWTMSRVDGNVYTLTSAASGKCLEVPGSSADQGTQLDQRTCDGGSNQRWAVEAAGTYTSPTDSWFVLVNLATGWAADVANQSTTAGDPVVQWVGNGGYNQIWALG
ncbi:RICIN domain-containing protein [Streptomyces sp. NPDC087270]|uniref:RICIN domain-containing protein n=1 Tax=Streptomyces sp. NPDC087270 TaxID=3365774 RepID=UPI0038188C60